MQSVYEHITLNVTGMNETDNFLIGEPTISQNISELDASFDGSSNHVNHKLRLFIEYSLIRSCKDSFSLRFL